MSKSLVIVLTILLACQPKGDIVQTQADSTFTSQKVATAEETLSQAGCSYYNIGTTLGIGLIIVPESFQVFNDPLATSLFQKVRMYDEPYTDICSTFYKPDYGIMHFVCIDSLEKSYMVLAGDKIKFMPKETQYKFVSWEEYILTSFGIRRMHEGPDQDLKKELDVQSASLSLPEGHEMFCPMELKGDWVKVNYDCYYNREENEHEGEPCHNFIDQCEKPLTGWLQWRDGNTLLIDIFLMP